MINRRQQEYELILKDPDEKAGLLNRDVLTPSNMDNLREIRYKRINQRNHVVKAKPVEKDTVEVCTIGGVTIRVYSLEVHGENYKELANKFVNKMGADYKVLEYKEQNGSETQGTTE